jgi:hypothetical protein
LIFKSGNIIYCQKNNQNIVLRYFELLKRTEFYKISNLQNYSVRNAWTSLGVWYKHVGINCADSHMSNHIKLVKKLNEDL